MSIIVTDTGFGPDDWSLGFTPLELLAAHDTTLALAVDIPSDADPAALQAYIDAIDLIRVDFPSFADGRGFSIARKLRRMGYAGRLRAGGHVIADQYAMARRTGFDEVEIDSAQARRQPEAQWLAKADWRAYDYQSRLRA